MKRNKIYLRLVWFVLVVMVLCGSVHAELPRESIFYNTDLENLSIGLGFDREERLLRQVGGSTMGVFKADSGYAIVGYDLNPWLSVEAALGQSEAKSDSSGSDDQSDEKEMWMLGMQFNIWQGDIFEPAYLTSRCRVQSSISLWKRGAVEYGNDINWDEFRADLVFSIESFVRGLGEDKSETPYSLTVLAGVVHSSFTFDGVLAGTAAGVDSTFDEDESMGLLAGVRLKLHHNLWLEYEARVYEETSHTANLMYHF